MQDDPIGDHVDSQPCVEKSLSKDVVAKETTIESHPFIQQVPDPQTSLDIQPSQRGMPTRPSTL